jgi:hypothetical protein
MTGTARRPGSARPTAPGLATDVGSIKVTRTDDIGTEDSREFTDLSEAVQAVARQMARTGVYEIYVAYQAG